VKKWILIPIVTAMLGAILLSGCAVGVAPEDITKLQGDLTTARSDLATVQNHITDLEASVADLSAISAYNVWYDQYYEVGTYVFADTSAFNTKLGALIEATGDSASRTSWNAYLAADTGLTERVEALPADYDTWTEEQTSQWTEATTARTTALGEVGTALFNAIVQ